jgi:hypothetical protein
LAQPVEGRQDVEIEKPGRRRQLVVLGFETEALDATIAPVAPIPYPYRKARDGASMAEPDEAAVLERAKALAKEDGFTWELDFEVLGALRTPLRDQHFLSKERQQEYLERAPVELRQEPSNA